MKIRNVFFIFIIFSCPIFCQMQSFVVINWTNISFETGFVKYLCCGSYSHFEVCDAIEEYSAEDRWQHGHVMSVYIENVSSSPFFDINNLSRIVTIKNNVQVRISLIVTEYNQIIGVNICSDPNYLWKTGAIKHFIVYNFSNQSAFLDRIDYYLGGSSFYPNAQCIDNSISPHSIEVFPIDASYFKLTNLYQGKEIAGHTIASSMPMFPIYYNYGNCYFNRLPPVVLPPDNPQQMMVGVEISNAGDDGVVVQ